MQTAKANAQAILSLCWAQSPNHLIGHSEAESSIMIICLCNVDPLTPHFYIGKLGCTGLYIIVLFLLLNMGTC